MSPGSRRLGAIVSVFALLRQHVCGLTCGGQPSHIVRDLMLGTTPQDDSPSLTETEMDNRRHLLQDGGPAPPAATLSSNTSHLGGRRRMLGLRPGRDGHTPIAAGCSGNIARMKHENDISDPKIKKSVKPSEEPLVACIHDITQCGAQAQAQALALPSIKLVQSQSAGLPGMGPGKRFKSCALVGNGGSVRRWEFGKFINNHEVVVRFNLAAMKGHGAFVGNRTSFRMMDHRQSVKVCCLGKYPWLMEADDAGDGHVPNPPAAVMWFTAAQEEVLAGCKRNFPDNARYGLSIPYVDALAESLRAMRKDLLRLGFGPFGEWKQLTTGGHAVLLFSRICDSVSLYGFTTYNTKAPDQYAGRAKKAHSGEIWHDWEGEKHAWRLLHAAGRINICSV
mmetsp:Transcript_45563/g.87122  ORF Transcript_45563/g.87122 Transcript_45563/m.87122 type:complete len:393 (+) Transcript_45563:81-1259(+)